MAEGQIVAIFLKRARGGPMDAHPTAELEAGGGLVGNADRGGRRQVTLLARERWDELMETVGASCAPEARRANIILTGINLENSRGRTLLIGRCRLRIGGETRPCELMEQTVPGLQSAMRERWGGGAFAEVLEGGAISVGDSASWDTL